MSVTHHSYTESRHLPWECRGITGPRSPTKPQQRDQETACLKAGPHLIIISLATRINSQTRINSPPDCKLSLGSGSKPAPHPKYCACSKGPVSDYQRRADQQQALTTGGPQGSDWSLRSPTRKSAVLHTASTLNQKRHRRTWVQLSSAPDSPSC